jgi:DNA-binding NarL/FixJ family response regulator
VATLILAEEAKRRGKATHLFVNDIAGGWVVMITKHKPAPPGSAVSDYYAQQNREDLGNGRPALSPRRRQTLRLLLLGRNETQIATSMGIGYHTVHEHVKAIYRAHGVRSRAQLMSMLLRDRALRREK